jgi:hypothetical protein
MNDGEHESFEVVAENALAVFIVIVATNALKAATSEEYREGLKRRSELREELSAPEWFPHRLKPYYNIVSWRGRLAYFVGQFSVWTPINWYRYPVLQRIASWSMYVDIVTRWEAHDDWPVV